MAGLAFLFLEACAAPFRSTTGPAVATAERRRAEAARPTRALEADRSPAAPRPRPAVRLRGDEVVGEEDLDLTREERLHLVLEAGACYFAHVLVDVGRVHLRLVDEHGHEVARSAGPLSATLGGAGGVCPRWSGSFQLAVTARRSRRGHLILERYRADRSDPQR